VHRNPLTAQQESELKARRNGISLLFGCGAADLDELVAFLSGSFGPEFFQHLDAVGGEAEFESRLEGLNRRERDGTSLFLVSAACPWNDRWIDRALQRVGGLISRNAFVRVLFVADPIKAWDWPEAKLERLRDRKVTMLGLQPWHDNALRQWLEDWAPAPRDLQGRARITVVTGNWPLLLRAFQKRTCHDPEHWEHRLQELASTLTAPAEARSWLPRFGLTQPVERRVLAGLAELGDVPADDLAAVLDLGAESVLESLQWADRLALARPSGGAWRVDSVVGRLLQAAGG
jgi:hypothetical protein